MVSRLTKGRKLPAAWPIIVIALITVAFFCRQIFLGHTMVPVDILYQLSPWNALKTIVVQNSIVSDAIREGYPWMDFFNTWIKQGVIPWWNPMIFSGAPVPSAFIPIFYPIWLLYMIMPPIYAYGYIIILQVFLAGLFMYLFLRELDLAKTAALAGGLIFMFSQILIHWSESFPNTASMLWLPLLCLLATKVFRTKKAVYAGLLAAALAMNVFGSQFQFIYFSFAAFGVYCVYLVALEVKNKTPRRDLAVKIGLVLAALIAGASVTAIQMIPTFEVSRYVARAGETVESLVGSVLHPRQAITFLMPNFFGNPVDKMSWVLNLEWFMDSGYVGIAPLLMAVIGAIFSKKRAKGFFIVLAAAALLLTFWPVAVKVMYYIAPMYNRFRNASRWVFVYAFAVSGLAAFGVDYMVGLIDDKKEAVREIMGRRLPAWAVVSAAAAGLALIAAAGLAWLFRSNPDLPNAYRSYALLQGGVMALLLAAALAMVLLAFLRPDTRRPATAGLIALIVIDIFIFNFYFYPSLEPNLAYPETKALTVLDRDKSQFRVMRYEGGPVSVITPTFTPNTLMVYGIQDVQGSSPFLLKRYAEFMNIVEDQGAFAMSTNSIPSVGRAETAVSPLLDAANVKYFISVINLKGRNIQKIADEPIKVYKNTNAMPRAYVVYGWRAAEGDSAVKRELTDSTFNAYREAVIEGAAGNKAADRQAGTARITSYEPNRVEITADAVRAGYLVLSDVHYPGWTVTVDGKQARLYRANYTFRAAAVRAGKHKIVFEYEPSGLRTGAKITAGGIIAILIMLVAGRIKRRFTG